MWWQLDDEKSRRVQPPAASKENFKKRVGGSSLIPLQRSLEVTRP